MPLFQHQLDGVAYLEQNPKAYLAHKPGTGKTRTTIAALHAVGAQRPLIVCPAIVRSHWFGAFDATGAFLQTAPTIMSYDDIRVGGNELMAHLIRTCKTDALVLDEAHYLKHADSQRTLQLLGQDGYARRIDRVWALSGTPIPRNPAEIWTLMSRLRPDVPLARGVKTYQQFVDRYCITRGRLVRGVWREKVIAINPEHETELRAMLGEIMQVRESSADVPPIWWQMLRLDAAEAASTQEANQMDMRRALQKVYDGEAMLEDIAADPHVARMRRRLGELKVKPVVEMLRSQLENSDEKVAVFAHHHDVIWGLREGLEEFGATVIDGSVSEKGRENAKHSFIVGSNRVFIGQNIACQTGMDGLQHATNRAVLVEPDWSADVNYQLGARVARMGSQYDHAVVQMVALAGTLDEAIVAQNKRETEMVASAMPTGA